MSPLRNFHEGEVALQAKAGVDTQAFDRMVEEGFRAALSPNEVDFVNRRTFSVAATIDAQGRPWASPLIGPSGELFSVQDPVTVRIDPPVIEGDPLREDIAANGELGVLFFEPSRRRRAKSMGRAVIEPDGAITYRMRRSFGLCTKYIFKRRHEMGDGSGPNAEGRPPGRTGTTLDETDRAQIEATDTVFLASQHEEHGSDPTHRGGPAGFVTVVDDATVSLPDYVGNGMFQTLGNLLVDDRVGLLTIDFTTGRAVQITGHGTIVASPSDDIYSERTLVIAIDEVRSTWPDIGQWTDIEAFDLKPGLINPATPYL